MRILFRDEKYVAENVAILGDIAKDANLTGNPQVYFNPLILLMLFPALCMLYTLGGCR